MREKANRLRQRALTSHDTLDPIGWLQANFYPYDQDGALFQLYEPQVRPLRVALSRNGDGHFNYNTIVWSWPKKSAKSMVIASVCHYVASHKPNASIKLVANDLKQADSRVGYYLRESLKIGARKGNATCEGVKITPSGYLIEYPNGARVECVPTDPSGEAGGNDDLIVYSELWGWKSKAHQRMWSEMTLSPTKFGSSQRWIDTYAGFTGESPILEQLYAAGLQGTRLWDDHEVYANEQARLLMVWVTQHLLHWQQSAEGLAYYAQEAANLAPNEYDRMHRNQWVSPVESFIPIEWWNACKADYASLAHDEPAIMALDAAVSSDCFAVVIVSRRDELVYTHYSRAWTPPKGGVLNFAEIEQEIRRLIDRYYIVEMAFDPFQLHDMSMRLKADGIVFARPFNQGTDRAIADKRLYDLIRDRGIRQTGEAALSAHLQNANRKPEDDNKLRIIKRSPELKIDLAVALSMAAHRSFAYAGN